METLFSGLGIVLWRHCAFSIIPRNTTSVYDGINGTSISNLTAHLLLQNRTSCIEGDALAGGLFDVKDVFFSIASS